MEVVRLQDPREFDRLTKALLLRDEARHNLILGLTTTLNERPHVYDQFLLAVVEDRGHPVAAAIQTVPFNLAVSRPSLGGALALLARDLHQQGASLPGAVGGVPEVEEFVRAWSALSGKRAVVAMAQGIYRLQSVRPPRPRKGSMRDARPSDRDLLVEWMEAFRDEALGGISLVEPERMVDLRLDGDGVGLVLWEEGDPVSVAGFGGRTPNGTRIGPVYTPPALRRRGYASALVAALSQRLLDEGRTFCFLYTDMSNPTSNRIYRDIGYERVCDSMEYRFEETTRPE